MRATSWSMLITSFLGGFGGFGDLGEVGEVMGDEGGAMQTGETGVVVVVRGRCAEGEKPDGGMRRLRLGTVGLGLGAEDAFCFAIGNVGCGPEGGRWPGRDSVVHGSGSCGCGGGGGGVSELGGGRESVIAGVGSDVHVWLG